MTVTFCGHSTVYPLDLVQRWLHEVIEGLIVRGARKFYLGGYGTFDQMAAAAVWEQKRTHPEITSVLVLPYLDRKVSATEYDYTTYPPLESVPRRFAISRRNQWMVDNSDILVAFVTHDWGGAATTLKYAERKKKEIMPFRPFFYDCSIRADKSPTLSRNGSGVYGAGFANRWHRGATTPSRAEPMFFPRRTRKARSGIRPKSDAAPGCLIVIVGIASGERGPQALMRS